MHRIAIEHLPEGGLTGQTTLRDTCIELLLRPEGGQIENPD